MAEYVKDNYDLFKQHDYETGQRLSKFPVCDCCGNPIQDESYHRVGSLNICDRCLGEMKVEVEEW